MVENEVKPLESCALSRLSCMADSIFEQPIDYSLKRDTTDTELVLWEQPLDLSVKRKKPTNLTGFTCECGLAFDHLYTLSIHLQQTGHNEQSSMQYGMPGQGAKQGAGSNGGSRGTGYPYKLVRGQDLWLIKGLEKTEEILKCIQCGQSFESLPDLTIHMMESRHYAKIISTNYHDTDLEHKEGDLHQLHYKQQNMHQRQQPQYHHRQHEQPQKQHDIHRRPQQHCHHRQYEPQHKQDDMQQHKQKHEQNRQQYRQQKQHRHQSEQRLSTAVPKLVSQIPSHSPLLKAYMPIGAMETMIERTILCSDGESEDLGSSPEHRSVISNEENPLNSLRKLVENTSKKQQGNIARKRGQAR